MLCYPPPCHFGSAPFDPSAKLVWTSRAQRRGRIAIAVFSSHQLSEAESTTNSKFENGAHSVLLGAIPGLPIPSRAPGLSRNSPSDRKRQDNSTPVSDHFR